MDALELELEAVVSVMVWVLGTEFQSSRRTVIRLTTEPALDPSDWFLQQLVFIGMKKEKSYLMFMHL